MTTLEDHQVQLNLLTSIAERRYWNKYSVTVKRLVGYGFGSASDLVCRKMKTRKVHGMKAPNPG